MDRVKARNIVSDLRNQHPPAWIAKLLGIRQSYVSGIENMTHRPDNPEVYWVPPRAIKKVLEVDRVLNSRIE